MSGLFGGSSGKNSPEQINVPAFTSSGGITQPQDALGQYSLGQDLLAQGNLFGSSGTGQSTMATQGAEGAKNTEAMQLAGFSDTNQLAEYGLYGNEVQGLSQNLSNALTLNQAPSDELGGLAGQAGFGSGISTNVNIA